MHRIAVTSNDRPVPQPDIQILIKPKSAGCKSENISAISWTSTHINEIESLTENVLQLCTKCSGKKIILFSTNKFRLKNGSLVKPDSLFCF